MASGRALLDSRGGASKSPTPTSRLRRDRNTASPNTTTVIRTKAKLPCKHRISRDSSREDDDQRRKLHCLKLFKNRHKRRGAVCDTGGEKGAKRVKHTDPESKKMDEQPQNPAPQKDQDQAQGKTISFGGSMNLGSQIGHLQIGHNHGLQTGVNHGIQRGVKESPLLTPNALSWE
ncbi:hypothetical protein N7507_001793 [Penicillium longicatenatum]|nr:hypothetical protein N7507_001793 [Penicillium longicatenatum]